jgi:EAL domain-containing protein (putative c-di-GMP-specific phosphodiesterase class I)
MLEALNDKIKLENILLDALANDGFKLLYQPQVHTKTLEIVGFEALIRLKSHSISPATFIDVAEEQGCIKEIGRWVTAEAIAQLATWFKQGLTPKFISINFSSKQINDDGYVQFLKACLTEHQISPELVEIEITESILLEEDQKCTAFLDALRRIGVKIALDDFGTGYSSINYLTYMPLTKIKLDKSLIDKFFINPSTKLLENIITLVGNLDLEITAEGIEFPHQYTYLKNSHCDYIQGYLFSKPLSADEIPLIWNKQLNDKIALPK